MHYLSHLEEVTRERHLGPLRDHHHVAEVAAEDGRVIDREHADLEEVSLSRGQERRQVSLQARIYLNLKHKTIPNRLLGIVNVDDLVWSQLGQAKHFPLFDVRPKG